MTGNLERRMDRLEHPAAGSSLVGLVDQLQAARNRWRDDPEGARRDAAERRRRFLAECDKAMAEGRTLPEMHQRMMRAYHRADALDGEHDR